MGLFALRKTDQSSFTVNQDDSSASNLPEKSVTQFIRSRFSGRKKFHMKLVTTSSSAHVPSTISPNDTQFQEDVRGSSVHDQSNVPARSHEVGSHRTSSDAITMTLAQRLNELATAHAEGLLSDDDYRILRQNLFSSFTRHSALPAETPVVKSVEPVSLRISSISRSDSSTIHSSRAPSLLTYTTGGSSVSTLFHRFWKRSSQDHGSTSERDRSSFLSSPSRIPLSPIVTLSARGLGRQASTGSLKTGRSRHTAADLRSVSSRRSMRSVATASEKGGMSRGSTRSFRGNDPPPSSFNPKHMSSRLMSRDGNADHLRSAADIRAEIHATEAELQNVLATFPLWTGPQLDDTSVGCVQAPNPRTLASDQFPPNPGTLRQSKRSASDPYGSDARSMLEERSSNRGVGALGSCNDRVGTMVETQTDELGQRRAEVSLRYQQRLDYLRARLKGAEIHERLLRR